MHSQQKTTGEFGSKRDNPVLSIFLTMITARIYFCKCISRQMNTNSSLTEAQTGTGV